MDTTAFSTGVSKRSTTSMNFLKTSVSESGPKPRTRFTKKFPPNFVWKDEVALLRSMSLPKRGPQSFVWSPMLQPDNCVRNSPCCVSLPVFQTPPGSEPSAAMAGPATLQWETWRQGGHRSPSPRVARTAQSSTASTQTRISSIGSPTAVGSLAAPSAMPTSLITPISLLTWRMTSLQTPSPGGSLPKGYTGKKSDWTLKQNSTWPTSLLCSSHLAQLRWCWKDPRTTGRLGGPTSISLSTVQRLLDSRMIWLRRAPCARPGIQMQCPAPEER